MIPVRFASQLKPASGDESDETTRFRHEFIWNFIVATAQLNKSSAET
jgi:hypothetical protein